MKLSLPVQPHQPKTNITHINRLQATQHLAGKQQDFTLENGASHIFSNILGCRVIISILLTTFSCLTKLWVPWFETVQNTPMSHTAVYLNEHISDKWTEVEAGIPMFERLNGFSHFLTCLLCLPCSWMTSNAWTGTMACVAAILHVGCVDHRCRQRHVWHHAVYSGWTNKKNSLRLSPAWQSGILKCRET